MRVSILSLIAAASAVTAEWIHAPVVRNNPPDAAFVATLPKQEKYAVTGSVIGSTHKHGTGVKWTVSVDNLPAEGGPFMYHVHKAPVPSDGNCSGALSHLDPYGRGDVPACDPTQEDTCEVGDLSGKYGKIEAGLKSFHAEIVDLYTSTNRDNVAFIGNLSVVFHFANKTRFACANFISGGEEPESSACSTSTAMVATGVSSGYAMPTGTGGHGHNSSVPTGAVSPTTPGLPEYTNAASKFISGAGAVVGFAAALLL
ncbi:hypothetical protein B5807_09667 [Epicoccum nigrum]|uniref:superoxide dismutase n=1 Tax=Epicoccum nigrum TaxID=105696 RepID=A0A1Y2LNQ8_EPING|nr:hypothetical protein B5807_09667 [Epicoccum nigrum]